MSYFEEVIEAVNKGKEGKSIGLPMGLPKLTKVIPNIQKGLYYAVLGAPGSGKSSFALQNFIYNPYTLLKANNPHNLSMKVFLYSFEISKLDILTKAIARKLYFQKGYVVDVNFVLSRGKNRITEEVYQDVMKLSSFYEGLEDTVTILGNTNPTGVLHDMEAYFKSVGKVETKTIKISEDKNIEVFDKYTPENPDEYVIILIDHIGLTKRERGFDSKANIDKLSEYMVSLRNKYQAIPVIVSQLNRNMSSSDRFKQKRVIPTLDDIKGSAAIAEDANTVIALLAPSRYDFEEDLGYDITKLKEKYINLSIIKNREGIADVAIGLHFIGQNGVLQELPAPAILDLSGYGPYTDLNIIENFIDEEYGN